MTETMNCCIEDEEHPWASVKRALNVSRIPMTTRRVLLTPEGGPSFSVNVQELIETIHRVLPNAQHHAETGRPIA